MIFFFLKMRRRRSEEVCEKRTDRSKRKEDKRKRKKKVQGKESRGIRGRVDLKMKDYEGNPGDGWVFYECR